MATKQHNALSGTDLHDPKLHGSTHVSTDAIPVFTSTVKGIVPLSGGGTTNFLRADGTWAAGGGGATDHGALTGLGDDDHTQYLLVNGTRAMSGDLDVGGNAVVDVNTIYPTGDNGRFALQGSVNPSGIMYAYGRSHASYPGMIRFETPVASGLSTVCGGYFEGMNNAPKLVLSYGLNMNSKKIVSVLDPTSAQDAATKNYVDTLAGIGTLGGLSDVTITSPASGDTIVHDGVDFKNVNIDTRIMATKLDDFTTPNDNTDLDSSTVQHGLLPKLGGGTVNFLRADGSWAPPPGAAGGETNTASNQGVAGVGVYYQKVGVDLQFKNINAANNQISITEDVGNHEIDIGVVEANIKLDDLGTADDNTDLNATTGAHGLLLKLGGGSTNFLRADGTWAEPPGASGGEANTGSNVGTAGVGVFKQKTGVNLEFKKINAGSGNITITDDVANSEVDINVGTNVFLCDGSRAMTNHLYMGSKYIYDTVGMVADDVSGLSIRDSDITHKITLASTVYAFVANAVGDMGNNKIVLLADPTSAQDAATKNYVDTAPPSVHENTHESGGSDAIEFDSLADGATYKKFLNTERTKLSGIETGADVTDATNVNAAGALMRTGGLMTGNILPDATASYRDLGSAAQKWDDVYAQDVRADRIHMAGNLDMNDYLIDDVDDIQAYDIAGINCKNYLGSSILSIGYYDTSFTAFADCYMSSNKITALGAGTSATDAVRYDQVLRRASADINSFAEKTTPVNADIVLVEDSAASYAKKKVQVGNLPGGYTHPSARQCSTGNWAWASITGKPSTYPPSTHENTHESGGSDAIEFDSLADGATYKKFLATERTKLAGVDTGADVTANNAPQAHDHTKHTNRTRRLYVAVPHKTTGVPDDYGTKLEESADDFAWYPFHIPIDFVSLLGVYALFYGSVSGNNAYMSFYAKYATVNEDRALHSESDTNNAIAVTTTNTNYTVAGLLSSATSNDHGILIARRNATSGDDTNTGDIIFQGFLIIYTADM